MSDENEDIPMAQCGNGSIVPLDSESCLTVESGLAELLMKS